MAAFLTRRWMRGIQGGRRVVDWTHPVFQLPGRATVMLAQHGSWEKRQRDFIPTASHGVVAAKAQVNSYTGPYTVQNHFEGVTPYVYTSEGSNSIRCANIIPALHSRIYAAYTDVHVANPGVVSVTGNFEANAVAASYGTGSGSNLTSSRRDWDLGGTPKTATALIPNTAMNTAPVVYMDGQSVGATLGAGSGSTYGWGTYGTHFVQCGHWGRSTAIQTDHRCGFFMDIEGQIPESYAATLSENPWQVFRKETPRVYFFSTAAPPANSVGVGLTKSVLLKRRSIVG